MFVDVVLVLVLEFFGVVVCHWKHKLMGSIWTVVYEGTRSRLRHVCMNFVQRLFLQLVVFSIDCQGSDFGLFRPCCRRPQRVRKPVFMLI